MKIPDKSYLNWDFKQKWILTLAKRIISLLIDKFTFEIKTSSVEQEMNLSSKEFSSSSQMSKIS